MHVFRQQMIKLTPNWPKRIKNIFELCAWEEKQKKNKR